jgi:hypothetical protein
MKRATLAMAMAMNETPCFDIHMKQSAQLQATDSKNDIARGCEAPLPSCISQRHAAAAAPHRSALARACLM